MTTERKKKLEEGLRRMELQRFIDSHCKEVLPADRESRAARLTKLKRRVKNLLNDLSRYMDHRRVPLFKRRKAKRMSERYRER